MPRGPRVLEPLAEGQILTAQPTAASRPTASSLELVVVCRRVQGRGREGSLSCFLIFPPSLRGRGYDLRAGFR